MVNYNGNAYAYVESTLELQDSSMYVVLMPDHTHHQHASLSNGGCARTARHGKIGMYKEEETPLSLLFHPLFFDILSLRAWAISWWPTQINMEAVGAAASIIAIAQAVQGLVQFALYLQSLRGLGGQADALILEVCERLSHYALAICILIYTSQQLQYFPMYSEELQNAADFLNSIADREANNGVASDLNTELISATQQEMQRFVQAVEEFQKSCEKLRLSTESRASKLAWIKLIPKKNDLQELRERAQTVRPRFHETMSVLMSYQQRYFILFLTFMFMSCQGNGADKYDL